MTNNLIPASELPAGASVRASDLTAEGRASLHEFLSEHARHYRGHSSELERWISQGVLDSFADSINQGGPIEYRLGRDASKDGTEHLFHASPADVLCEMIVIPGEF